MTTAEPSSQATSSTSLIGSLTWLRNAPRWVLIASIVASLVVGYWIYTIVKSSGSDSSSGGTDTKTWTTSAMAFLTGQGYSAQTSQDAVHAYVHGQPLTPSQIQLIASAIGAIGLPSGVSSSATTTGQLSSAPASGTQLLGGGTGNPSTGGTASTTPGAPYPGSATAADVTATSYWYVPVGVAGWSSTFSGIAQQFYGDSAQAVSLQQLNPNLSTTTYGKLPVGKVIKVPRTT